MYTLYIRNEKKLGRLTFVKTENLDFLNILHTFAVLF